MMASRMAMGRRPNSAGSRPSSSSGNRPNTANGRPSTANGRPSTANGRPGTAESVRHTQRARMEERIELRKERKAEKARLKAEKPKLEVDWKMRGEALWMMFSMSYYPKIVLGLGILMLLISIILIAVGASTEDDLADGDLITALLFVFGFLFIVASILAIRSRRIEKEKRRRLGYDKKTGRYGTERTNTDERNGTIATISEDVSEHRGHINGIPLDDIVLSEPKPKKTTFSAVKADEETGFTNLAVMVDADQLPGTPYRQRRRESIEKSISDFKANQILASASLKDDPDILVVPPPRSTTPKLSPSNKSSDRSKVKKSKSPINSPNKGALDDIPEIIPKVSKPEMSPRQSPIHTRAPPIMIIDTDELGSSKSNKKHDYTNDGFDDGDITPNDLT